MKYSYWVLILALLTACSDNDADSDFSVSDGGESGGEESNAGSNGGEESNAGSNVSDGGESGGEESNAGSMIPEGGNNGGEDGEELPTEMVGSIQAVFVDSKVEVSWRLPIMDRLFDHVRVIRTKDNASTGPDDGVEVYSGRGEAYTDEGLTETATFFYTAYTCNAEDACMSEGRNSSVNTLFAPTEPVGNFVAVVNESNIQLSWTAPDDPAFDHVRIQRMLNQDPGLMEGDEIYNGSDDSVNDTPPYDGSWHYTVFSCNTNNVCGPGVSASAILDLAEPVPVINFRANGGDQRVNLSWELSGDINHSGVKICRGTPDCTGIDASCSAIHTSPSSARQLPRSASPMH